ncbi:transposase [Bradyrhizobium sp. 182]|nr:transposase [Bradyrhizobium sp. 182]
MIVFAFAIIESGVMRQAANASGVGKDTATDWHFFAPGKPMQNGFIRSFNAIAPFHALAPNLRGDQDIEQCRDHLVAWIESSSQPEGVQASVAFANQPATAFARSFSGPIAHFRQI